MSTCFSRILCLNPEELPASLRHRKRGNRMVFPASIGVRKSDIWASLSKIDCVPSEDWSRLAPCAVPTSFKPKRYVVLTRNCLKGISVYKQGICLWMLVHPKAISHVPLRQAAKMYYLTSLQINGSRVIPLKKARNPKRQASPFQESTKLPKRFPRHFSSSTKENPDRLGSSSDLR